MAFRPFASIKGKKIGKTHSDVMIAEKGIVAGRSLVIEDFDDFLGDVIADQWAVNKGSDGGAANFAVTTSSLGGVVRATTGAGAGASMAANGVLLEKYLGWKANMGNLSMEARLKMSAISTIAVFVGFTDQVGTLEMPIGSAASAETITTVATDAVGLFFDTSMTTDNWWAAGVKNDVDATHANTGKAPVADTWAVYKIEVDKSGNAVFYIDGRKVAVVNAAVTATVALTPVIAAFRRAASSATVDVDYVHILASRG
jgi:hypothetical protein